MSLTDPNVRRKALALAYRRALDDQLNVPLSSHADRQWSRAGGSAMNPRNNKALHHHYRQGHHHQSAVDREHEREGMELARLHGRGRQTQKDREDEKLGAEMRGVKDREGGAKKQSRRSREDESKGMKLYDLGKKYAKEVAENEPMLKGGGFWGDFADGFMSVIKPVASVAGSFLGLGKKQSEASKHREKEGMKKADVLRWHEKNYQTKKDREDESKGAKGSGKKQTEKDKEDEKLGAEMRGVKDKEGGAKKESGCEGAGKHPHSRSPKKRRRKAGANDGRRRRAVIVKRIMKEKGLNMPQASKYVKEHGLYKKK